VRDFLRLRREMGIPASDLPLYFEAGDLSYSAGGTHEAPLMNNYNFAAK
jgi:hypothetical protein